MQIARDGDVGVDEDDEDNDGDKVRDINVRDTQRRRGGGHSLRSIDFSPVKGNRTEVSAVHSDRRLFGEDGCSSAAGRYAAVTYQPEREHRRRRGEQQRERPDRRE